MITAIAVRARLQGKAKMFHTLGSAIGDGNKGALIGDMNHAFGGDVNRRIALGWLWTGTGYPLSSKSLGPGQWWALKEWVGSYHDDSGWHVSHQFMAESIKVLESALIAHSYVQDVYDLEKQLVGESDTPMVMDALANLGAKLTRILDDKDEYEHERRDDPASVGTGQRNAPPPLPD